MPLYAVLGTALAHLGVCKPLIAAAGTDWPTQQQAGCSMDPLAYTYGSGTAIDGGCTVPEGPPWVLGPAGLVAEQQAPWAEDVASLPPLFAQWLHKHRGESCWIACSLPASEPHAMPACFGPRSPHAMKHHAHKPCWWASEDPNDSMPRSELKTAGICQMP